MHQSGARNKRRGYWAAWGAFSPGLKPGHGKIKRLAGLKPAPPDLKSGAGTARLESGSTQQRVFPQPVKSCPHTKHEFFGSRLKLPVNAWLESTALFPTQACRSRKSFAD